MKAKIIMILCSLVLVLSAITVGAWEVREYKDNTFFGWDAGHKTTSKENTFIGSRAGDYNTNGHSNTFVGHEAGKCNIFGNYNTFVGYWAGYKNDFGDDNTFIGMSAGNSNTGGSHNTFVGCNAGLFNQIGLNNTFYGYKAGKCEGGYHNTILGYHREISCGGVQKSNYNTFVGHEAGIFMSGSANVCLGAENGYKNYDGNNNVFLGFAAGHENLTGSGNVFLGSKAGYNEKGSNRLYIANSNTSAPLIYGEFDNDILSINGKVGIGTKPSTHPLEIAGGAYTDGLKWYPASSRAYKDDIEPLSRAEAFATLAGLTPVKFVYKADRTEQHVGFIAEDVPELVATKDRKGLSEMDIVAVLTKVVQERQEVIQQQQKIIEQRQRVIAAHSEKIAELEQMLKARGE